MTLRRRDLGTLEKAAPDILMSQGVITDDSQIVDLRLAWSDEITVPAQILIMEISYGLSIN